MRLVDSHMHFDTFLESGEAGEVVERARQEGVEKIVAIGGTAGANRHAVELAAEYAGEVFATVGYDRDEAGNDPSRSDLEALVAAGGVVGIGETGLDYHYSADTAAEQKALFQEMLDVAQAHSLPVVVHSREADEDTLSMLSDHRDRWKGDADRLGVLHCFTGDEAFAQNLVALGYAISFSGILTFKNAEALGKVARGVPLDSLLIETDAPYLAPVPYRGKRNEPAYVRYVAECLAEIRNDTPARIADSTACNAERLFNLEKKV